MTIIFFGNTKYSTIGLETINKTYPLSFILTKKLDFNPIVELAKKLHIPYLETNKIDEETIKIVKNLQPDFFVVEDYGVILPPEILKLPKFAPLNIHHSLLPKYRGPSPAPSAILAGEKISGVSIIKMAEEVDAGDILAQEEYELSPDETTDSLLTVLNKIGAELAIKVIKQYLEGSQKPLPQDHSKATLTKHFTKEDGYFDINNLPSPEILDRMIRAYYPWPGVWCKWQMDNGQLKIVKFLPAPRHPERSEGSDDYLLQMEGKKAISKKDFLNGYPDFPLQIK